MNAGSILLDERHRIRKKHLHEVAAGGVNRISRPSGHLNGFLSQVDGDGLQLKEQGEGDSPSVTRHNPWWYWEWGIWMSTALWGTLFNWQYHLSTYLQCDGRSRGEAGRMVSAEAAQDQTVEGQADQTEDMDNIPGWMRQYLQCTTKAAEEKKDRTGCSNGRAPFPGK